MAWEGLTKDESLVADGILKNLKTGQFTPKQLIDYARKATDAGDYSWARSAAMVWSSIPEVLKRILNSTGSASIKMLGPLGAAVGGWGVGRKLGQTPLITDPNMTYDQFYQGAFQNLQKAKTIKENQ